MEVSVGSRKTTEHRRKRRVGVGATVGLVVEGDAEFYAFPRLHKKHLVPRCPPLKLINLHGVGSDRTSLGIAKRCAGRIAGLKEGGCSRVVLCLDREQRLDCAGAFATSVLDAVRKELASRNQPSDDVHVVVADRAFEAWILADARGLHERGHLKNRPKFMRFEGELGERQEKGVRELSKLLNRDYSKTKDGPALFEKIDFAEARLFRSQHHGSRSLDKFLRTLGI